jgi:hypothetical protein
MNIFLIVLAVLAVLVMILVRLLRGRLPTEITGPTKTCIPTRKLSKIEAFTISLEIEKQPSLFILLSDDGGINRMGRGTADTAERELFIGKTDPAIFKAVCSHFTKGMLQTLGRGYQAPEPLGASCELTITFKFKDGSSNGIAFRYGSESEGPPKDVADFVIAAVRQTDPWYQEFRRDALRRKQG